MKEAKHASARLKNVLATALAFALTATMLPSAALADTSADAGGGSL